MTRRFTQKPTLTAQLGLLLTTYDKAFIYQQATSQGIAQGEYVRRVIERYSEFVTETTNATADRTDAQRRYTEKLTISITPDLKTYVRHVAKVSGVSAGDWVRGCLRAAREDCEDLTGIAVED